MFSPRDCSPNAPSAFAEYSEILRRHLMPAIVDTKVDTHRPGDVRDGAFIGTVGRFQAPSAIVDLNGQWNQNYMGNVPVTAQQQITAPDPWTVDQGGFNG